MTKPVPPPSRPAPLTDTVTTAGASVLKISAALASGLGAGALPAGGGELCVALGAAVSAGTVVAPEGGGAASLVAAGVGAAAAASGRTPASSHAALASRLMP